MNNQFFSKKQSVHAKNGVVATSEGLAAQAGLEILKKGGNAIDAAVATAACLTVVEPTSNGIGSDCFAIVYFKDKLYGLNSSGYSSRNISIKKVKERGFDKIPATGIVPITVPGTPKGWASLIEKFGNLSLIEVLTPAIKLAEEGFIISETVGYYFERAIKAYKQRNKGEMFDHFFKVFTKNGESYKAGDLFKSQWHADTLRKIGETNSDAFYKGELSDKIVSFMEKYNGFIDKSDLEEYQNEFVEPISINYKGFDICEIPPNGQGITALMALNLLKEEDFTIKNSETYHKQIEALKIAFSDTLTYVTDPLFMKMNPNYLLSEKYIKLRKKDITDKALNQNPIDYKKSGTVYLATADSEGNMVSFIQSNYMGFGSGIVIDDTGISIQNRGHTFSLDENHHNKLEPRKRTYHTIIPGFIMKDKKAYGPFGVMGGFMQPQGHLQVVMNLFDFNMNPQEALDAPRFRWDKALNVAVENSFDQEIIKDLEEKGHIINLEPRNSGFGRGQIIFKQKEGYIAGTETRCDGHIAYY
ncbi:gamma-glutamyltransferase [Candidatus Izemoplasma sp. B36]|uniref:gamma-glutamyltransferase n=1 Tax=Candidatus Izemoplasma sp. B36 TaxID=3242468 RepID=UPI003558E0E5